MRTIELPAPLHKGDNSIYTKNKNIVIVETVVMYGIINEIDVSVVVFCLKVSVVPTILCWILDPVCKTMHYNFHTVF